MLSRINGVDDFLVHATPKVSVAEALLVYLSAGIEPFKPKAENS